MLQQHLISQPLRFRVPLLAPGGVDPAPLRRALYGDDADLALMPEAGVLLCLLPAGFRGEDVLFFQSLAAQLAATGARPIFALDGAGLPRQELPLYLEQARQTLARQGYPGAEVCLTDAAGALKLAERADPELTPWQLELALLDTGIPDLAAKLRALAGDPGPEASGWATPAPAEAMDPEPWVERIEAAAWEELPSIEGELRRADPGKTCPAAWAALARRRWERLQARLEETVAGYETAPCQQLLELARRVQTSDYPAALREKTLQRLREAYDRRETEELEALMAEAVTAELPVLREMVTRVENGPYTDRVAWEYIQRLYGQMNLRHLRAMEQTCAGLDTADRQTLAGMRKDIEARPCLPELKQAFLARLEERVDGLDQAELEALTAGAEKLPLPELEALARRLEAPGWNPKLINRYRGRVELCRQVLSFHRLGQQAATANGMDRAGVLALHSRIKAEKQPRSVSCVPLELVEERLYRLDLLALTELENNFDNLGYSDIDRLRQRVERSNSCDRARRTYLDRLSAREHALVYESTASRAALVQQLIPRCRLRQADFDISLYTPDYDARLRKFWGGSGKEQPRDIPVFLFSSASVMGMSGTRFWYSAGRGVTFVPLREIADFRLTRQMLAATLMIQKKDGSFHPTDARLYANHAGQFVEFLNECLRGWTDDLALPQSTSGRETGQPAFSREELSAPVPLRLPDETDMLRILRQTCAETKCRDGVLCPLPPESWSKLPKLQQGFGLHADTKLVWYHAPSLLSAGKEGLALGPEGIYLRQGKQPAVLLPMEEIFCLIRQEDRTAAAVDLSNRLHPLGISAAAAQPMEVYCKGIQLVRALRQREAEE